MRRVRIQAVSVPWVGDSTEFPMYLSNGSMYVLVAEPQPEEKGLYLANGDWHALELDKPKRIGF